MRPIQWHLKETLARPRGSQKSYSDSPVIPPLSRLVARRGQCAERSTIAPSSACCSTVYRYLKRSLGRTLRRLHCKRHLVIHGKSPSYKLSRTEGSSSGPESFRASVQGPDCPCCDRQHNSGLLRKQTREYEVRLALCSPTETSVLVPPQGNHSEGEAHSRLLECDSGQAFQTQSSDSNRIVPISAGAQSMVLQMGPTSGGFICDPIQSQTAPVCLTSSGPDSLGGRRLESTVGGLGDVHLSPSLSDSLGNLKVKGSWLSQNDPHCPRVAKHALVLGPSESISSDPFQVASDKGPGESTIQRVTALESQQLQIACTRMHSILAGRLYSHLVSEQDATGPDQSPAQDVFF